MRETNQNPVSLENLVCPRYLIYNVKWDSEQNPRKSYLKLVNDYNHAVNLENYYEKKGGKVYGIYDSIKNKDNG